MLIIFSSSSKYWWDWIHPHSHIFLFHFTFLWNRLFFKLKKYVPPCGICFPSIWSNFNKMILNTVFHLFGLFNMKRVKIYRQISGTASCERRLYAFDIRENSQNIKRTSPPLSHQQKGDTKSLPKIGIGNTDICILGVIQIVVKDNGDFRISIEWINCQKKMFLKSWKRVYGEMSINEKSNNVWKFVDTEIMIFLQTRYKSHINVH